MQMEKNLVFFIFDECFLAFAITLSISFILFYHVQAKNNSTKVFKATKSKTVELIAIE